MYASLIFFDKIGRLLLKLPDENWKGQNVRIFFLEKFILTYAPKQVRDEMSDTLILKRHTGIAMYQPVVTTSVCHFRRNSSEMGRTTYYFQGYIVLKIYKKKSCELFFPAVCCIQYIQVGPCAPVMRINLIKYLTIKFEIFGWRARFQGK